jgi:hypothetical protein
MVGKPEFERSLADAQLPVGAATDREKRSMRDRNRSAHSGV